MIEIVLCQRTELAIGEMKYFFAAPGAGGAASQTPSA